MGLHTVNSVTVIYDESAIGRHLDEQRILLFCPHLNDQKMLIVSSIVSVSAVRHLHSPVSPIK